MLAWTAFAWPALADIIGKEVKVAKAEIAAGGLEVSGTGRANLWYQIIVPLNPTAVIGVPYQAKSNGQCPGRIVP